MISKKHRILIVEDDADQRNLICKMLNGLGHVATAYASGKEALAAFKLDQYDLAMLDIMMPEMNGYEVLQELRKVPGNDQFPVIMVTARDDSSEFLEGYNYGADYYISKPYTSSQLDYGIKLVMDAE
jgi:CheY-like chemotaxis protein